jgi:hypothetical protein
MAKILKATILMTFLTVPAMAAALQLDYPSLGGVDVSLDMNLSQLVSWFYYLLIGISGLAAFAAIVQGGVIWLTSAGSPSRVTEAKDRIGSAFLGLVLVLGSWLILRVVNPDLTTLNLQLPGM